MAAKAIPETLVVSLTVGDNTIAVPAGVTWGIIITPNMAIPTPNPPFGGTLALGAGGVISISSYGPTVLNWAGPTNGNPAPPATIVVNSSATGQIYVQFG
jgi:hypothetical protein